MPIIGDARTAPGAQGEAGWRDRLRPASFRGAEFRIDTQAENGGRRPVPHDFPKRNDGFTEDMGRRLGRFVVTGYVIGKTYTLERDRLKAALRQDGPGMLQLPTSMPERVIVDTFTINEAKDKGNLATFEMQFFEAGDPDAVRNFQDTQGDAQNAADSAAKTSALESDGSAPFETSGVNWPQNWQTQTPGTVGTSFLVSQPPASMGLPQSFALPPQRPGSL